MKKYYHGLVLILLIFSLVSCTRISFIHPVSNKKEDRVFKKELLGKWNEDGNSDKAVIIIDTSVNYDSVIVYNLAITGDSQSNFGDSSYLNGELFNIQGKFFMMISSDLESKKIRQIGLYNAVTILPSYYMFRIFSITNDSIQAGQIDGDHLMELIKSKKLLMKYEELQKDDILILEKPGDLKRKLIEMDKFPDVYERITYKRIKE